MKTKLGVIGAILVTAICVSAQEVKSSYDQNFDFSKIKTFYVTIMTSWGNPTNEQYAKKVVAIDLSAKGWTEVPDRSAADALVMIHGATETKNTVQNYYAGGYGGYDWSGQAVLATKDVPMKVGTAMIDIFDAKTKKLIFRGTGEGELDPSGEKNREKIDKGVQEMFKDFPPKAKS